VIEPNNEQYDEEEQSQDERADDQSHPGPLAAIAKLAPALDGKDDREHGADGTEQEDDAEREDDREGAVSIRWPGLAQRRESRPSVGRHSQRWPIRRCLT
jgi:hypothetical protein